MAGRLCDRDIAIFTAMVATEFSNVFVLTLFKAASLKGMSSYVFLVYSYAIGALLLLPFTFFSLRSSLLPPLSSSILWKMGLLGLVASTFQMAGFTGIKLSSPTLSSAMANVTPAFTFILAIIFRMEKISVKKWTSMAKVVGTTMSIGGALVAVLYHGPAVFSAAAAASQPHVSLSSSPSSSNWAIGGGFLALQFTLVSVSYILMIFFNQCGVVLTINLIYGFLLRAHIMSIYPSAITVAFSHNVGISVMSAFVGFIVQRSDPSAWNIHLDITLVSMVVTGIMNSAFSVVHLWAVLYKGPLFLSLFKPISIFIAIVTTAIFLGESLSLGSLIGGIVISIGFYTVMLGKSKEEKSDIKSSSVVSSSSSEKLPLL